MTTRAQFPPDDPDVYQVQIAGIFLDSRVVIVDLKGLKTGVNLDIKEAPGINGASITHQGRKFARFSIEFRAGHGSPGFDPAEGYALLMALATVAYKAGGAIVKGSTSGGVSTLQRAATPVAVRHPILAIAEVNAMIVEEIDWPERQDDLSYVMSWSCIQYAAPAKINVTSPMQGDVLNGVGDTFSGAKGPAPASSTSPQLPQPPPIPPSSTPTKP